MNSRDHSRVKLRETAQRAHHVVNTVTCIVDRFDLLYTPELLNMYVYLAGYTSVAMHSNTRCSCDIAVSVDRWVSCTNARFNCYFETLGLKADFVFCVQSAQCVRAY